MQNTPTHPALQPIDVSGIPVNNRLAVAPMTRVSAAPDGTPTDQMATYYAGFAHGGFGIVITEGVYTDTRYSQGYLNQPGMTNPAHEEAWQRIAKGIKAGGAHPVMQLMHAGALSQGNRYTATTAGPSAVRPKGEMMPAYGGSGPWPVPHELTRDDIDTLVTGFTTAARAAHRAGFSGVEVHAANGYLLDQFLTDYTNVRTDEYGDTLTGRIRLTVRVVDSIRSAVPDPRFWVGVRFSQGKVNDHHHQWASAEDAETIFSTAAGAGASYLHVAGEGQGWDEAARLETGETLTGLARRTTGLPVIANGNLSDPRLAALALSDGHADLISLARPALADPAYPRTLARGDSPTPFSPDMLDPTVTLDSAAAWHADRQS